MFISIVCATAKFHNNINSQIIRIHMLSIGPFVVILTATTIHLCTIYKESLTSQIETVKLIQKGSDSINSASRLRGDTIRSRDGETVHFRRRLNYCNKKAINCFMKKQTGATPTNAPSKRSEDLEFSYHDHCLFCGMPAKVCKLKRGLGVWRVKPGTESGFQATIQQTCHERNDSWADIVSVRIQNAPDLSEVNTIYHETCSSHFRTQKQIPIRHRDSKRFQPATEVAESELSTEITKQQAFLKVCKYLEESDGEQTTVGDLVEK